MGTIDLLLKDDTKNDILTPEKFSKNMNSNADLSKQQIIVKK